MGRIYTVSFDATTIAQASGDYDLFELVPADDRPLEVTGMRLFVTSETGDAAEEWLRLLYVTDYTTSSNGTSTTPRPVDPRDAAAGFTAETVGATVATTGTPIAVIYDAMNVRNGYEVWFPDRHGPRVDQADTALYIRLNAAVTDDVTMTGTVWVHEV